MFYDHGVLISVPAADLAGVHMDGSVVETGALFDLDLPRDLKFAIRAIHDLCEGEGLPSYLIARPEIFINEPALRWMSDRVGRIRDHVCISDGRAVRVIPRFNNHVLFFRLGAARNFEWVRNLQKRCPELIQGLGCQINSVLPFRASEALIPVALQPLACPDYAPSFYPFCLSRYGPEHSARLTLGAGLSAAEPLRGCAVVSYVPLTELALSSEGFRRLLAARIAEAHFDPTAAVVMVLPPGPDGEQAHAARIADVVGALHGVPAAIPPTRCDRVILATEDCPDGLLFAPGRRVELLLHHSVDAWMRSPEHYARFDDILFAAAWPLRSRELLKDYAANLIGRAPSFYWLEHLTPEPNDAGLGLI